MKTWKKLIAVFLLVSSAGLMVAGTTGYFEISKNIDIFISLYKKVDELYVDEVNHSKIMRKGIDAMLGELDPYTVYFSESQVEDFKFEQTGSYGGIGARVGSRKGQLLITDIYENSPSIEAGLMVGDILKTVDGKDLTGKKVADMSELLKGEPKTDVVLEVERGGQEKEIKIKRAEIKVDNVSYSGMLNDHVGYVKFENFRMDAAKEVREKMEEMKKEGMTQFILDMRGNPGGLLKEAVDIVNLFVDANKLVVSTKGKNPNHSRDYKTYKKVYDENIELVVLVDGGSASASEIVSGSIQDYDRGVVVGRNSYGKGLVQITQPITYNAQLKVTTSKYYLVSGRCIQRLDYASRDEDGNVPEVPDSLITPFKTVNGRTVLDGAGVNPDVRVKLPERTDYLKALIKEGMVFDFCTAYQLKHKEIDPIASFKITDQDLSNFKSFLSEKDFSYETKTEKKLEVMEKTLVGHKDSINIKTKLADLDDYLKKLKFNDFDNNKEEIRELIRLQLIERYYYRSGKAEATLQTDPDIKKAMYLLDNRSAYQAILNPA